MGRAVVIVLVVLLALCLVGGAVCTIGLVALGSVASTPAARVTATDVPQRTTEAPAAPAAAVPGTPTPRATPAPKPTAVPTAPAVRAQARYVDPRELASRPRDFDGQNIFVQGETGTVDQRGAYTWIAVQAQVAGRSTTESVVVELRPPDPSILRADCYRFYGVAAGTTRVRLILTGAERDVPLVRGYGYDRVAKEGFSCAAPGADEVGAVGTEAMPAAGASRSNPVPPGQPARLANGLEVTVVGYVADAWPLIQRENRFNNPPGAGNRFSMVRLRVANVGGDPEREISLSAADFRVVGSSNQILATFEASCGVYPEQLRARLLPGGQAEGYVCWKLPADETNLVVIAQPGFSEAGRRYLAVGQ